MKKIHELEALAPASRRRFLKWMGAALGGLAAPEAVRHACNEVAGGVAYAQTAQAPMYFIEINLRDQWDHLCMIAPPGLATRTGLRRGDGGDMCPLFVPDAEMKRHEINGTEMYLSDDAGELAPHLNNIAMMEIGEIGQGAIHGHNSANPLRSPGHSYQQSAGKLPMYERDPISNFPQGCEQFYSSTPTPASLYNHYRKTIDPKARNGVAFKGIGRPIHTAYHFGAGLPGAELDRIRSRDELFAAFPASTKDLRVVPTPEEAAALRQVLSRVDSRYLTSRRFAAKVQENHALGLGSMDELLYPGAPKVVSLPLTDEERAYWSAGVPNQASENPKAQIWEWYAWATKLVTNDLVHSVAMEYDFGDVHDRRGPDVLRVEAKQLGLPLARMIASLKQAGIFDRTVISVFCTDGSRSAQANSTGNMGKNPLILAGGKIRGGYFGDVRVTGDAGDGHTYSYHAPDLATGKAGAPLDVYGRPGDGRVPGNVVYRTVMKAIGMPDKFLTALPDVGLGPVMSFMGV